jgi:Zn-dependent protease with chaperone function
MVEIVNNFLLIIFSIGLLISSLIYVKFQEERFFSSSVFLILIAYLQGFLISIYFFQTNYYFIFSYAILFGGLYYIVIPKVFFLLILVKEKFFGEQSILCAFENEKLINTIVEKTKISRDNLHIHYIGKETKNAFRKFSLNKIVILLGRGLEKILNFEEMLFVVAHEIGHTKNDKKIIFYFIIYSFSLLILSLIISFLLPILGILNIYTFFLISIILFIVGIMGYNYISWSAEFKADEYAVIVTKDVTSAESFFIKFSNTQKDYPKFINLIFYDHPPIQERIDQIKKINLPQI